MTTESIPYRFVTLVLRFGLVVGLFGAGWFVYDKLPNRSTTINEQPSPGTNLQIVVQPGTGPTALNIPVELLPIDVVAARHEYFDERRAGKRFEDFLKERMNGRSPVSTRLNEEGHVSVLIPAGTWWIHALLAGDEDLEWRLRVDVTGQNQTVTLTPENAYTRARSF